MRTEEGSITTLPACHHKPNHGVLTAMRCNMYQATSSYAACLHAEGSGSSHCNQQALLSWHFVLTHCHGKCSGLHFTAAVGNAECTRMLCEAGADIDLGDKQGNFQTPPASFASHTVSGALNAQRRSSLRVVSWSFRTQLYCFQDDHRPHQYLFA